jgi:hypothetical protein
VKIEKEAFERRRRLPATLMVDQALPEVQMKEKGLRPGELLLIVLVANDLQ